MKYGGYADMNGFDIFVIIVISFCLIRGYFRGFIREISSIVGVAAGFYGAHTYYVEFSLHLGKWINWGAYGGIASFFLLFCAIFFITSLIGYLIRKVLHVALLGWVDRLCGIVFGALKGFLVISVVFIMLTALLPSGTRLMTNSRLAPYVAYFSEMTAALASKELKGEFKVKFQRIKVFWEQQKTSIQGIQKNNIDAPGEKI